MIQLLTRLTSKLPRRVIEHYGSPYLERFYLCGRLTDYFAAHGARERLGFLPTVYIHHFLQGDADHELHNHPWRWALALMLVNGYVEERRGGSSRRTRTRVIKWVNLIPHGAFHRVAMLLGPDAWTLIIVGPRVSSWGFLSRDGETVIPWGQFVQRQAQGRCRGRVDRAGRALLGLVAQIKRLSETSCPTMKFGHSPGDVLEVVRAELCEVEAERPTSTLAQRESADVLAAAIHLTMVHHRDPVGACEFAERKLRRRLDVIDDGGTWQSAKVGER